MGIPQHQDAKRRGTTRFRLIKSALVSLTQTLRSVLLKFRRKTQGVLLNGHTQTHTNRLLSEVRFRPYSFPSLFFQYI